MRNAPSVTYPVGRSRFYAWLLVILAAFGLLAQLLWWWYANQRPGVAGLNERDGWVAAAGAALWMLWVVLAWRGWGRVPVGRVQWDAGAAGPDGEAGAGAWRWHSMAYQAGATLQRVDILLDLQDRMLLRVFNPSGVGWWIWAERGHDPANWMALRRALVASGR